MSADPYGFAEGEAPRSSGQDVQALYAGIGALIAAAVGPCVCYVPYVVALPLGAWAVYTGWRLRASGGTAAPSEAALIHGAMLSGGVAVLLCTLVLFLVCVYALFLGAAVLLGQDG